MQSTTFRSTNTTFHLPLTAYLLVTFGSARLIWFPLLLVIVTWAPAMLVIGFNVLRNQKGLRKQIMKIGESSI